MQVECRDSNCKYQNGTSNPDAFPESLERSINKIISKEGYKNPKVLKKQFSTNGGSYLASLYDVKIEGETEDGEKVTNLFIKHIIPADDVILSITEAYYKESLYYNELAILIKELEDNFQVPSEDRLNVVKSYESNNEDIILENLEKKGFRTWHRMEGVNLQFAELAFQQLARLHGAGYVLQLKRPDYFAKKIRPMKHHFACNEDWKTFMTHQLKISTENLSDDYKEKAKRFLPIIFEKYPRYFEDTSIVGATLCHADWRSNNMLIMEDNSTIKTLMPVDFQLLYYGCPINDLLYFIHVSTDQDFRNQHMLHLKNYYYNSLEIYLKHFNLDANNIYPRKEFEKQFKDRLDYGLMVALMVTPFCFTSEDKVPDMGADDFLSLEFAMDYRGFDRVRGIMDDFIKCGLL